MSYTIEREDPAEDARVLRAAIKIARSLVGGDATPMKRLIELADSIEEQVKPPKVDEPEVFGSIVRATEGYGTWLWQKTPAQGKHYWESETGAHTVWSELSDVEVLRVGIGDSNEPSRYEQGFVDFGGAVRRDLSVLRADAITAERKDAYDKALATVAALLGES